MKGSRAPRRLSATIVLALAGFYGCHKAGLPTEEPRRVRPALGLEAYPVADVAGANPAMIDLGRELFFDERLSKDSSISCASCHIPVYAFAEPSRVAHGIGHRSRKRNTPSVLNSAFEPGLDWDGRAATLEDQVQGVFSPSGDMGIDIGEAVAVVRSSLRYHALFAQAFGREPYADAVRRAIAAFERSLPSADSRFDRFFFHGDSAALSDSEKRGWALFNTARAGCGGCHVAFYAHPRGGTVSLFTDHRFKNLGVGYADGYMANLGRYVVTQKPEDWGRFKTRSLRNVALTAPYMPDGSIATLEEVVSFYNKGGIPNPNLDPIMGRRSLTDQEEADIAAFLRTLTTNAFLDTAAVRRKWAVHVEH